MPRAAFRREMRYCYSMPKKGVVISLAAKCQLLFGLAVLVIIAGALAVPWQRMEQLAGREPVHDARTAAGDALRYLHVFAGNRPAPPNMQGPFFPPTGWQRPTLFHLQYPAPLIIPLPNRKFVPATHDQVTLRALRLFRHRPNTVEWGRVEVLPGKIRIYRYAAAVRADISCIRCHSNWRSRLMPRVATAPGTLPALPPLGGPPASVVPTVKTTVPAPAAGAPGPVKLNTPAVAPTPGPAAAAAAPEAGPKKPGSAAPAPAMVAAKPAPATVAATPVPPSAPKIMPPAAPPIRQIHAHHQTASQR